MGIQFNPKVNQNVNALEQWQGKLGGLTAMQPRVSGVSTGNEYGISIPTNCGYTTDEGGNRIALGNDGVGLAHRNPLEFGFMAIA